MVLDASTSGGARGRTTPATAVAEVRVVLVTGSRPARDVTAQTAEWDHGIVVAATADDLHTAVLQVKRTKPAVVVVSATVGDWLASLCRELRALNPRPRVLLADGDNDTGALLWAIESGVDGYLTRRTSVDAVAEGIRALARGEAVVPPTMLGPLLRRLIERRREADRATEQLVRLTRREREVLARMVEGSKASEIADDLVISPETVRTHIQRILRKLEVHSRDEAVALAARTGLADRLERVVEGTVR